MKHFCQISFFINIYFYVLWKPFKFQHLISCPKMVSENQSLRQENLAVDFWWVEFQHLILCPKTVSKNQFLSYKTLNGWNLPNICGLKGGGSITSQTHHLSYSTVDTQEKREIFPSYVLLVWLCWVQMLQLHF